MQRTSYLLLFIFCLLIGGCLDSDSSTILPTPTSATSTNFETEIQQLIVEQRFGEALQLLEQSARTTAKNQQILLTVGQIYLRQQRWLLAEDAFNRAIAQAPNEARAYTGLAEALLNQGDYAKALNTWERAIELDPKVPGGYTGLGRTYLQKFDFPAAIVAFETQIEQTDDLNAAWYLAALHAPHDITQAQTLLAKIEAAEVDDAGLLARHAYLADTLAVFDADSPQAEVATKVGVALAQIEQWPLAIYALQYAYEQAPTNSQAITFLAHARAQAGQPALELFKEAHQLNPESALPLHFQAIYLRQQGAWQAAEALLKEALELDPTNAAIYVEWAKIKEQQGDLAAAELLYRAAVEVSEQELDFQLLLISFYASYNYQLSETAIPLAEELVVDYEDEARLFTLLGWMQFLSGAPDGGEAALHQAIELDPTSVNTHYYLGRVLETKNQIALAEQEYLRVVDLDHSNVFRNRALQDLQRLGQ